jgi:hypothetical protein
MQIRDCSTQAWVPLEQLSKKTRNEVGKFKSLPKVEVKISNRNTVIIGNLFLNMVNDDRSKYCLAGPGSSSTEQGLFLFTGDSEEELLTFQEPFACSFTAHVEDFTLSFRGIYRTNLWGHSIA